VKKARVEILMLATCTMENKVEIWNVSTLNRHDGLVSDQPVKPLDHIQLYLLPARQRKNMSFAWIFNVAQPLRSLHIMWR
jgi:hypothetical protein